MEKSGVSKKGQNVYKDYTLSVGVLFAELPIEDCRLKTSCVQPRKRSVLSLCSAGKKGLKSWALLVSEQESFS